MRKKKNGFAVMFLLILLPVVLAAFTLVFSALSFQQIDLAAKFQCRQVGLQTQGKVGVHLQKLLKLNPKAVRLRAQEIAAQKQLAFAKASGNAPAVTAAAARLAYIKIRQQELGFRQRQLITQSNLLLTQGLNVMQRNVQSSLKSNSRRLFFLKLEPKVNFAKAPQLAVRPDYPDTAPTYSPSFNFEIEQALALDWQYNVSLNRPFNLFLNQKFHFTKACSVTLEKEGLSWSAVVAKGKFSLKSVW